MFTGIVTSLGTVTAVERDDERLSLTIESSYSDLADGDSVAVTQCRDVVSTIILVRRVAGQAATIRGEIKRCLKLGFA